MAVADRPTTEEEGKEKTQEFKIPVAAVRPPPRGRTLRRTTLPRTIRDYGVGMRLPAASDEAFHPTSSSNQLHDLKSCWYLGPSSISFPPRRESASHICALLILRSAAERSEGGRPKRRSSPLDPTKVMVLPKGQCEQNSGDESGGGGRVAARNREHDLAVEDRVSAEKSLGKEGETVSKRGLSLGSAATFFMRTR